MQSPPAEMTPRANASSSSMPDARVSRPTNTFAAPVQSDAARPSRSTSSGVRNSPTTPRTPSVPKYLRATMSALALAELRRLARLVQAGLLALHDARVAREEASPLQRDPELGVRPRRARGRCRAAPRRPGPRGRRRERGRAGRTARRDRPSSAARSPASGGPCAGSTPRSSCRSPTWRRRRAAGSRARRRSCACRCRDIELESPFTPREGSVPEPRADAPGPRRS